jgi:hypothetical protein
MESVAITLGGVNLVITGENVVKRAEWRAKHSIKPSCTCTPSLSGGKCGSSKWSECDCWCHERLICVVKKAGLPRCYRSMLHPLERDEMPAPNEIPKLAERYIQHATAIFLQLHRIRLGHLRGGVHPLTAAVDDELRCDLIL